MGNSPSKYEAKTFFLSCKTQPQLLASLEKEAIFMLKHYPSFYRKLNNDRHKRACHSVNDRNLYERLSTVDFNGYIRRAKNILSLKKFSDDEVKEIAGILSRYFWTKPSDGEDEEIANWCNTHGVGVEQDEMSKKYLNFFQKMEKVDDVLQNLEAVIAELGKNYEEIFLRMNDGLIEKAKLIEMIPSEKNYFLKTLRNVVRVMKARKSSFEPNILEQIENFLDQYISGHMSRVSTYHSFGKRNIEGFIEHWRCDGIEME